jgi:histidine triad (HIT) family protein/ATP adenylyltransferase
MDEDEFLALQRVVRRVAGAVSGVVPTERMYSLSLGSKQGNAHLHWHVAPLPPGVPYDRQQYYALMMEKGVLGVDGSSHAALARDIRNRCHLDSRSKGGEIALLLVTGASGSGKSTILAALAERFPGEERG